MLKKSILVIIVLIFFNTSFAHANTDFADVSNTHWAYNYVTQLRELGLTDGIGDNYFGLGSTITKAEFVTFLCKLLNLSPDNSFPASFSDNQDKSKWYFGYIEVASKNGIINNTDNMAFYPNNPITREEMAIMITRSLGLDNLAIQLNSLNTPFSDVVNNKGYINIAKDLGIISGLENKTFSPSNLATREQSATMIVKMYQILNNKIDFINGFYAIKSFDQVDKISLLDSVSFGWNRLELLNGTTFLNTTTQNQNEYNIPDGFEIPLQNANGKQKLLLISVKDADSNTIINDKTLRDSAVMQISNGINNNLPFDGVVIDFETLKGEQTKSNFNEFLYNLKNSVPNKSLYVAVHPKMSSSTVYYDGYDYKQISLIADKIILMAHDYNAKKLTQSDMDQGIVMTPLAPISEFYYAIKEILNENNVDKNKVMIQLSFGTAQWKLLNDKVINEKPYTPDYKSLIEKINNGAELKYNKNYESPYITFNDPLDNTKNIIWYEDSRSIYAKLRLASLFGISDVSLWRLGNIPDDSKDIYMNIWDTLSTFRK